MRYFNCMLNTNSELIKANSKIRLNDYDYSGPIAALNKYMYRHLENGYLFMAYREQKNMLLAAFAFDERQYTYQETCDCYAEILNRVFGVKQMKEDSVELTMQEYLECVREARRREYCCILDQVKNANLWIMLFPVEVWKQLPI